MRLVAIRWPVVAGFAFLLGACGTLLNPIGDDPLKTDSIRGNTCHEEAVQDLVGQAYDEQTLERALVAAEADEVRLLRPDSIITKEYMVGRLNLVVGDDEKIVRVYCG